MAISIASAISLTFLNVKFFSMRRRFCDWSLRMPHTSRSRRLSSRFAPKSQVSLNFCNTAQYSDTLSPTACCLLKNRNRSAMTRGLGHKCSNMSVQSWEKVFWDGLAGAQRLLNRAYVFPPIRLKVTGTLLSSATSLAMKYYSRRSWYWSHVPFCSSKGSILPMVVVFVVWVCTFTASVLHYPIFTRRQLLRAFDNSRFNSHFKDDANLKLYPVLLHRGNGKSHRQIFLTITLTKWCF